MIKAFVLSVSALALAGCASSGGTAGSASTSSSTWFNSPKAFSKEEFSSNPKGYAKNWVKYNGGGVDSYKKITIPTYTLELQTSMYKVGYNKAAALLANADGAKSSLTMVVQFPWEKHQQMMQEIAGVSYTRLKEKFKKVGVEVVEWSAVTASNTKAAEYAKENMNTKEVVQGENVVSFMAPGTARPQGWSPYALSSLSRDAEVSLFFPNFGVGFGYFDGAETPFTIKEGHGMSGVAFTPQMQILSGSGFNYQSKWNQGVMTLDHTAVVNDAFVKQLVKLNDSRDVANQAGEAKRNAVANLTGSATHEVKVSSSAGMTYQLDIDAAKFKEAALAQLDAAENLVVERYKNEL